MDKSPHPYPSYSPNSNSNGANDSGVAAAASLPPTPKSPIPNPYPTTFVQADAQSFKQVVQMLTGSAETAAKSSAAAAAHNPVKNHPIPPLNRAKKPPFKLYERRPSLKNLKMIGTLVPSLVGQSPPSTRSPLSPSVLDFPSLALSPVTPLDMAAAAAAAAAAATTPEERAIAEKGYYLHPSPRPATTPGGSEPPRLLPLFPLTSPRD